MAERMKILVPDETGKLCETIGESMDIRDAKEPWSEYVLEDGIKIRARQTVVNIVKLDKKNPDGTPAYLLQSQPMMLVIPPME
jgi:hypothetical protein